MSDSEWRAVPPGGAEMARLEILHQRSVHFWRLAYSEWLTVAVGLGMGMWPDESDAERATAAIRVAMQAQDDWYDAIGETSL